jgi:hypothetical protein
MKPSEMIDRMYENQEAYIAELVAENEKLQTEVWELRRAATRASQERLGELMRLTLAGQLTPEVAGAMLPPKES